LQPNQGVDGHRAKTLAIVFAILGFFVCAGVIFGALAVWQANKAEAAGVKAKLWFALGVVDIVASALLILSQLAG
jgi:uncharacterized Tic20 family protein